MPGLPGRFVRCSSLILTPSLTTSVVRHRQPRESRSVFHCVQRLPSHVLGRLLADHRVKAQTVSKLTR